MAMTVTSPEYQSYLAQSRTRTAFSNAAAQARQANLQRYEQGMGLWDEIIQQYQPGGGFGAGAMAAYERGKTKAVGAGMQQLVSSGLANTTVAATIGKKYEEEVGTPFRLQLQDVQSQRLTEAQAGKAGFIERRTDQYPDAGMAAGLGQQAGYAQGIQAGGYGGSTTYGDAWSGSGRREEMPQAPSTPGITGAQTRGGQPYQYGGPNIGQIRYQGEEPFSPTGTGGEPKAPGTQDAEYQKYLKDWQERIVPTMVNRGYEASEITPASYERFKRIFGGTYQMPSETAAAKKPATGLGSASQMRMRMGGL